MSSEVALIGAGVMGRAILASVIARTRPERVRVYDARPEVTQEVAAEHGVRAAASIVDAADGAALVLLAVKPGDVPAVLTELAVVDPLPVVVSVAAGVTTAGLEQHLGDGAVTVRVMPNTPATIGQGVSVVSPGGHATQAHLDLAAELLAGTGYVITLPEEHLDVVTAISGSGPAYVFYLIEALVQAGEQGGLSHDVALDLARRTVAGAGALAAASPDPPEVLRERVSSRGGTTVAAIAELDRREVRDAVVAAVRKAAERAAELGRG